MKRINIINTQNHYGKTVLHYAVATTMSTEESVKLVSLLLKYGADPDCVDGRNKTPLFCAVSELYFTPKQLKIIELLLKWKCDSLNIYQYKSLFNTNFTLKQLCRTFIAKNCPHFIDDSKFNNDLPRELNVYLKRRQINIRP